MQELEKSLSSALGGLFFCLLAAMCFVSFSVVTSWGDHNDVSQALVMYVCMMSNVFVFCWLGSELSDQAQRVRDAAWNSNWVGSPVRFQRCLVFIIASANKEFKLTAGKYVPMANKTTLNMMNQTISFFMFLLHMKRKTEETI
ncbi:odorant receptor 2a-like [Zootermopsis nevadensis]|nr:odorant receptor 2a-like [Zootermopsis nevadensis]